MEKERKSEAGKLRQKAIEILNSKSSKPETALSEVEILELIHELEVHQIELEMQNEELMMANEEAVMAKDLYVELYDFAPNGYITLSRDGNIIKLNLSATKMLGKERSYLISNHFSIYVSDDFKTEFSKFLDKVFESQSKKSCEVTLETEDKLQIFVRIDGIISGNCDQCQLSIVDISERKQAELDLKESEEKYRNIVDNSIVGIMCSRLDGEILYANEALVNMIGFDSAQDLMKQSSILRYKYPEQRDQFLKLMKLGKRIEDIELTILTAKNEEKVVLISASLSNDIITSILIDISERKHAEESLRKSEMKYRSLIDNSSEVIFCVDQQGVYQFTNKIFASSFNKNPEDLIGKTYWDIYSKEDADKRQAITSRVFETSESSTFEIDVPLADKTLHFLGRANPIMDETGRVTLVLVNSVDITERNKAEELINQNMIELAELNQTKDRFFSIIAHDLRSPFNGFLGLTKLMAEDLPNFKLSEIQLYAQKMQHSASNLYKLLENLLDWSLVQRGVKKFHPKKYMLLPILKENLKVENEIADKKQIEILINLPADIEVFADLQMINTVLRNLISNAIKFTPRGGRIEIGAATDELNTQDGAHHVTSIYVKDNGIGMNPETLENVFKLDGNVNSLGTDGEPSTGLGLILCKEFIEKHGGKILAESEEGKGSTFFFTLPK